MKILKYIKNSPFKYPKKRYYIGKIQFGTPFFYPRKFCPSVYDNGKFGYPIWLSKTDLGWKDKYNDPRFEWLPSLTIYFFKWQLCVWYVSPTDNNSDSYYEMFLWWKYYCNEDIKYAKENWNWRIDGISTWNDDYLK